MLLQARGGCGGVRAARVYVTVRLSGCLSLLYVLPSLANVCFIGSVQAALIVPRGLQDNVNLNRTRNQRDILPCSETH